MISGDLRAACEATRRVCIVPHLGMGDMLVLAGMVRDAAARADEVLLFAKRAYAASVRVLFADLANLRLWFVDEAHELYAHDLAALRAAVLQGFEVVPVGAHAHALGLGARWAPGPGRLWTHWLYASARLDPDLQYAAFRAAPPSGAQQAAARELLARARALACCGPDDDFVVLHDDPARGFVVDRARLPAGLPVVHVDDLPGTNVFDYVDVLRGAAELHAIDSCFLWLHHFLGLARRAVCHAYAKRTDVAGLFDDPRGARVEVVA